MLVLLIVLLLLVVVFAVQNAQMVSIGFLGWSLSINMALVVLGSLSIGLLLGAVWTWFKGGKTRSQVRELTKALEASQKNAENLENALKKEAEKIEGLEDLIQQANRSETEIPQNER
ncbi:MAG: lipopolysaccharide assembly protein LapA domain-containing protein [Bacillota bacterium]